MSYNLFLDDLRHPYDAYCYTKNSDFLDLKWTIVRNYNEFRKIIEHNFRLGIFPDLIAFDHDLADEHYQSIQNNTNYTLQEYYLLVDREMTGYDCAKWLVNFCIDNDIKLPRFIVHSMNPDGNKNIRTLLENFKTHQNSESNN